MDWISLTSLLFEEEILEASEFWDCLKVEFLDFTTFVNNVQRSAIKLPDRAAFRRTPQAKRFRHALIIEPTGSRQEGVMTPFPPFRQPVVAISVPLMLGTWNEWLPLSERLWALIMSEKNQKRSPVKTLVKFFSLSLNSCTHSRAQGTTCCCPFTSACHWFKWSYDAIVCAHERFQVLFWDLPLAIAPERELAR